jgi:ketosteroid isomerase-like protein
MEKILSLFLLLMLFSCQRSSDQFNEQDFSRLMDRVAKAWMTQDTNAALDCFASDAVYMQPPDEQLYIGHGQLRPFFGALKPGTVMTIHHTFFDNQKQMGAAEFTFGNAQSGKGVTGVAVVTVHDGKIKTWREYFIKGPLDFDDFTSTEGKKWKWTIENYP